LKKIHHKKELLEWVKVYALTSKPRTEKKQREKVNRKTRITTKTH
jgi:hypothetical protein